MELPSMLKPALTAACLVLMPCAAVAGPFEDGQAAFDREDYATAMRLWRPLAEHGNAKAQYRLAMMYSGAQGVPEDLNERVKWLRRAAEQGHAEAPEALGRIYRYSTGKYFPQDYEEAIMWYRVAAERGNTQAQSSLGRMYEIAEGVSQDYAEARKWYRMAAEQGDSVAMVALGIFFEWGLGVPQDNARAHMWYNLATARNSYWARWRDKLTNRMTPDQKAKAQRLARQWLAKHQP